MLSGEFEGRWSDYLEVLTPWEPRGRLNFKRDDYFAPLGYGGPNGSKLRQLIWLLSRAKKKGFTKLVSAASVNSPQLSMSAIVGHHLGMEVHIIVGATKPETAPKHSNVQIASMYGAKFEFVKVGYNPYLQSKMRERAADEGAFPLEYGISLSHKEHSAEEVFLFHALGANQVRSMPENVETLVIPSGSCNTLTSILMGIMHYRPKKLKRIYTVGIGPNKLDWVQERLDVLRTVRPLEDVFDRNWGNPGETLGLYDWKHENIQENGFSSYSQKVRQEYEGINFHPTYEGKVMKWLKQERPWEEKTGFWIVGSEPQIDVIEPHAPNPQVKEITNVFNPPI